MSHGLNPEAALLIIAASSAFPMAIEGAPPVAAHRKSGQLLGFSFTSRQELL
jgi:hypothetical protein